MNFRFSILALVAAPLLLAGCGDAPQFSYRDDYHKLEPFAQQHVTEVLDQHFGTPQDMVAWERLPVVFHYAEGTVKSVPANRKVQLNLSEGHASIGPGTEVFFAGSKQSAWISEWDANSGVATFEVKLANTPTADEAVIVGPGAVLKDGRFLYAQHCQHCHGVSGDGNGPTAKYLNPRPRDYRNGRFKFTTTTYDFSPSRDDLHRIIREGIPGTYMPSFKLLKPQEMQAITEYVMWLSMRGEVEKELINQALADYKRDVVSQRVKDGTKYADVKSEFNKRLADGEFKETLNTVIDLMVDRWEGSQLAENLVQVTTKRPPATPESIAHGRQLYLDKNNKCASCHGDAGYGDGFQTYALTPGKPGPGLYDDWNNPVKPRNLHTGIFRGGRRPYDLFCRIRASVKGTPMPKFDAMKEEDIWDLVNYVYSIPYEKEEAGSGRTEQVAQEADAPAGTETPAAEPTKEVAVN